MNRNRWLLAILLLAVLLRVGVALYLGDIVDAPPLLTDQRSYHALGERLINGHGFSFAANWYPFTPANVPTAHWSFLQSLYIAGVYTLFGIHAQAARMVTGILGGLLLPWMVFRLTRRAFAPPLTINNQQLTINNSLPLLAALLAALYPYFILYSATLMTETGFLIALLWSLERGLALGQTVQAGAAASSRQSLLRALTLGLALGVATLFRQSILPWAPILFAWLLWAGWRVRRRFPIRTLAALTVAGVLLVVCIMPFTLRNYRVYGQFLLLNSNAGYAMYSAQHPMHGTEFREFDAAPLPPDLLAGGLNEAQLDRALMSIGVGFVLAEPGRYLLLSLSRVKDYFEFWPTPDTTLLHNLGRSASFGLLLPFVLYGLFLAVRTGVRARQPGLVQPSGWQRWLDFSTTGPALLLLFVLFYSILHILTWAFPRYRLPVDAVLMSFAALGLLDVLQRLARWTKRRLGKDRQSVKQEGQP